MARLRKVVGNLESELDSVGEVSATLEVALLDAKELVAGLKKERKSLNRTNGALVHKVVPLPALLPFCEQVHKFRFTLSNPLHAPCPFFSVVGRAGQRKGSR